VKEKPWLYKILKDSRERKKPSYRVIIRGARFSWRAWLIIGSQWFVVGPEWDSKCEAQWFAKQLRIALKKI